MTKLFNDAEAVAAGKHHVEDDALLVAIEAAFKAAVARVGFDYSETFLAEGFSQEPPEVAVVFDE